MANMPGSNERYLQPSVKLSSGDGTHAGRLAEAVIRLGSVLFGQVHSKRTTHWEISLSCHGETKKTAWDIN